MLYIISLCCVFCYYHWSTIYESIVKAATTYSTYIHASVEKDNVFACQFHPEKSGTVGLKILQNFADAILHGTPLVAPGYEGVCELTMQNAAYLSAWKGSVPVDLPFDEEEYDAYLERKRQTAGTPKNGGQSARNQDYSERWQIKW